MNRTRRKIGFSLAGLGFLLIILTITGWLAMGANTGWTKTYIEEMREDPVTGLTYPERVNRFVPGVDLAIPLAGAGFVCIFAGMVIVRSSKTKSP